MRTTLLPAGLILYHGTDNDDFDPSEDNLEGPAWLTSSFEVAKKFASRTRCGGRSRVFQYVLGDGLEVPDIRSSADMAKLAAKYNLDLSGTEEIRDSVADSGLSGWVIPQNYPDGDDILIVNTHVLDFIGEMPVVTNAPKP